MSSRVLCDQLAGTGHFVGMASLRLELSLVLPDRLSPSSIRQTFAKTPWIATTFPTLLSRCPGDIASATPKTGLFKRTLPIACQQIVAHSLPWILDMRYVKAFRQRTIIRLHRNMNPLKASFAFFPMHKLRLIVLRCS